MNYYYETGPTFNGKVQVQYLIEPLPHIAVKHVWRNETTPADLHAAPTCGFYSGYLHLHVGTEQSSFFVSASQRRKFRLQQKKNRRPGKEKPRNNAEFVIGWVHIC